MRKIAVALAALTSIAFSTAASAQMLMGDNPYDPGCNIHQGGNCGRQLDSWNHTWRRLGYPQEAGRGAYGTYLPGGGYVPNGIGGYYPGYGGVMQGYGGVMGVGGMVGAGVYGGSRIRTYTVVSAPRIIGSVTTCTAHYPDGSTETRPGHCP